jgi:hypothetical protein
MAKLALDPMSGIIERHLRVGPVANRNPPLLAQLAHAIAGLRVARPQADLQAGMHNVCRNARPQLASRTTASRTRFTIAIYCWSARMKKVRRTSRTGDRLRAELVAAPLVHRRGSTGEGGAEYSL